MRGAKTYTLMQNPNITLIKLNQENLTELVEFSRTTFEISYSKDNTRENMDRYLNSVFCEDQLGKELMNEHSEFYFTKYNDETAGYIKINTGNAQTDFKEPIGMELERIYVLDKFQGKKIGGQMIDFTVLEAEKRGLEYVWLGVWQINTRAINFYKRNGFEIVGTHPFKMGDEVQTDYIMKRKVKDISPPLKIEGL